MNLSTTAKTSLSLLIVFGLLIAANSLYAWTGPTATPPSGNAATPLNEGSTAQVKNGSLGVNSLAVYGNGYIQNSLGVGTASPIRSLTVNNGEISLIRYNDGNAYFNVSDINGSGSGNLTIRGLNSNGSAQANLGTLNLDANQVCINGTCASHMSPSGTLCGSGTAGSWNYDGSDQHPCMGSDPKWGCPGNYYQIIFGEANGVLFYTCMAN